MTPFASSAAPGSPAHRLLTEGYAFDFFQAVRLLERFRPERKSVGHGYSPGEESARFHALVSLAFPPSAIYDVAAGDPDRPVDMVVTFLGLFGPSGVLPRHYTEMLLRLQREAKGPERTALRDWLDIFNHRLVSLFYRAWAKYRFYIPYERGLSQEQGRDFFVQGVYSLIGLGSPELKNRLRVGYWDPLTQQEQTLARVEDLGLAFYGGVLATRLRNAANLEGLLQDYFGLPIQVKQFQGQWLQLDEPNQSRLGEGDGNNRLGVTSVAGERTWDMQGKVRIRVGPLDQVRFLNFLPDRSPTAQRKAIFLLMHLVRFYVGPDLSFDVQLVLDPVAVPECGLFEEDDDLGPRLGWNTWLHSIEGSAPVDDALFEGEEVHWVNQEQHDAALGLRGVG